MLRRAGLKRGDSVEIELNAAGHLELLPGSQVHRRVSPSRKITAEELLLAYQGGRLNNQDAWPSDDLEGKEQEAWRS